MLPVSSPKSRRLMKLRPPSYIQTLRRSKIESIIVTICRRSEIVGRRAFKEWSETQSARRRRRTAASGVLSARQKEDPAFSEYEHMRNDLAWENGWTDR